MSRVFGMFKSAILILVLMAAGTARAGWVMTHGSATQISDLDSRVDHSWRDEDGLTVIVATNRQVKLTLPLPSPVDSTMQVTKIKATVSTGYSASITHVRLYDGRQLVSELSGNWWGPKTFYMKIAPRTFVNGMVLVLEGKATFTPDVWYRKITVVNAGALFQPAP